MRLPIHIMRFGQRTNPSWRAFLMFAAFVLMQMQCSNRKGVELVGTEKPLTVIAIGDAGEAGTPLRDNARLINDMLAGNHEAGKPDAMVFLGDNVYPTGLNVPADQVEEKIRKVLRPFKAACERLGKKNVHAIAGNHDYYARNVIEKSLLFGLIRIEAGPTGISDRGNEREKAIEWWTYHYKMPAEVVYPITAGAKDSTQFIFYDSALPLKSDISTWKPALDSLRRLLTASSSRPGIIWRVLAMHHPWYSVGEHGGWSVWDDVENEVTYLPNCDKDSNVVSWFVNDIDPQDLCAEKYQTLLASLKSVIRASGAKIHLTLAGHEHNLQLLSYPNADKDCPTCPNVHIVSGAGAKSTKVKSPSPPTEFTAPQENKQGESHNGFAQLTFEVDKIRIVFFDSCNGEPLDMGGGRKEFVIERSGKLNQ